jgi:hypothetical protein
MRTRKEIMTEALKWKDKNNPEILLLEVLLDIRDKP